MFGDNYSGGRIWVISRHLYCIAELSYEKKQQRARNDEFLALIIVIIDPANEPYGKTPLTGPIKD